jgi:phosphoglycolate phosphatase
VGDGSPPAPAAVTRPVAVLFDVDETLVHTGGAGARSWKRAFEKLYDIPADIGAHTSAGETDPQVATETFRGVLHRDPSADELGRLYTQYLLALTEEIWASDQYHVLPGAEDTLDRLSQAGVLLGIVSGAMDGAARTKLMPANLNRFFVFGGYGSDSPDRAELTEMAIAKAARLHDQLTPGQVFVVGDTPLDIKAGQAAGAVAVGVASGHFSTKELLEAHGDHVLGSLQEPFPGF